MLVEGDTRLPAIARLMAVESTAGLAIVWPTAQTSTRRPLRQSTLT